MPVASFEMQISGTFFAFRFQSLLKTDIMRPHHTRGNRFQTSFKLVSGTIKLYKHFLGTMPV
jgi:hypothetical protein